MKGIAGDYPLRRELAAKGLTVLQAAPQLGLKPDVLRKWAQRNGVRFADARVSPELRRRRREVMLQRHAEASPMPLSREWMARKLTEGERADYRVLRGKGGYSVTEALASIGRHDLVLELSLARSARLRGAA